MSYSLALFPCWLGKAREKIEAFDWDGMLTEDINLSWDRWYSNFMSIVEECIPKKVLPSRRNLQWLNKDIKIAMRKRNTIFKKTGYSAKFRSAHNRVIGMLRRANSKIWIQGTQKSFGKWLSTSISSSLQSLHYNIPLVLTYRKQSFWIPSQPVSHPPLTGFSPVPHCKKCLVKMTTSAWLLRSHGSLNSLVV